MSTDRAKALLAQNCMLEAIRLMLAQVGIRAGAEAADLHQEVRRDSPGSG